MDRRGVDADLLEDAAMHHRHGAAAALALVTLPGRLFETAWRPGGQRAAKILLDLLEGAADAFAQRLEPQAGLHLLLFDVGGQASRYFRSFQVPSPVARG